MHTNLPSNKSPEGREDQEGQFSITSSNITQKTQKQKFSLTRKIKNWATNINFKIDNLVHNVELETPLIYLGRKYTQNMKQEFDQHVSETMWFSYREKIPSIMPEEYSKKSFTCDRGWGCMLRCGQMMLAEAIKRHFEGAGKMSEQTKKESLLTIVSLFSDFVKEAVISPFSIQQMCPLAFKEFGSKPGEWYRASTVMMTLEMLNDLYGHRRIKGFKVCVLKEGTIYEDQILQKALGIENMECNLENDEQTPKDELNNNQSVVQEEVDMNNNSGAMYNYDQNDQEIPLDQNIDISEEMKNIHTKKEVEESKNREKEPKNKKWENSVLVFVATKTGLNEHNTAYLPTILRLLKLPQSIGILGGKDTKGYYFLGFQGGTLLYLDPHYVQQAYITFEEMENKLDTHFAEKIFQISIDQVDTSIGFGFYIKDAQDYANFKETILKLSREDPDFLLGFQEETPKLDFKHGDVVEVDSLTFEDYDVIK